VTCRVAFTPHAEREYAGLDKPMKTRVLNAVARLAEDPFATPNVKALGGGGYQLRVGDWRVLCQVDGNALLVLVGQLGHRREVYRTR